ncbi:MRJP5 protein, partial [Acromyrmex charruanus]
LFITITNVYGPGSPATLTTVINKIGLGGPILRPYPNWSWYNNKSICDGIVNVYRADIQCNHIIILDNGKIEQFDQVCNPKLLIFDLKDDTLVKTIYLPLDFATNRTGFGLLTTPLVYVSRECKQFLDKMIVFITDTEGSGLVMYDSSTKRMCRIESDYMKPTDTFFSVANQNFTYEGGIFSVTILDDLYYVPISGKVIYKIKIKTLLECPNKEETNKQSKLVTKLSSQTAVITSSENSIFYSDYKAMSILGMNILNKSSKNAVELAQDDEKFQVISSMKVSSYWNQMTCISNRYQHFALHTLNLGDTNFRYFEMKLHNITCKLPISYQLLKMGFPLFILLILSMAIVSFGVEVNVIHEWKYADFEWRSQEQKKEALRSGSYNPLMCLFEDASKADDGRLFITVTNVYGSGSPATLTTVTNKIGPGGPILRPYPDWSWYNSKCMCDGIVNVYRTNIQCNHIIVLDNGKIGQFDQVCNPKLLIFDLKDDTLVKTIYLPLDFATNQTGSGLLITPLVYAPGECKQFLNKMIVFITDTEGSGLVVYESSTKRMCRVESDYMKPVDTFFSVAKQNFTHEGGIFSITVVNDGKYMLFIK